MAENYGHNKTTKKQRGWDVKDSKKETGIDNTGRVDLRVADFDKLLNQKGCNVKVYRSFYCPNVKSVDGAEHDIDCQLCNGSGYIDVDPIKVKSYFQTQELERIEGAAGYHDGNTVLATFPIGVELQYFARIDLCDFTDIYYQRILRATGSNVDILKYKACRVNAVVEKNTGARYYQDSDFTINPNGDILWGATRKPADGVIYSIHYECHQIYRAVKAMHVNRFTQWRTTGEVEHIKMNEQWMISKEFLLRKKDINTKQDLEQGPYDAHVDTEGDND